jgi:hypothetical protein
VEQSVTPELIHQPVLHQIKDVGDLLFFEKDGTLFLRVHGFDEHGRVGVLSFEGGSPVEDHLPSMQVTKVRVLKRVVIRELP